MLGGALLLASCDTVPTTTEVAKPAAPAGQPLPYRWTHGNAEKARQAMIDNFRRAWLAPGDFVWAEQVPTEGDFEDRHRSADPDRLRLSGRRPRRCGLRFERENGQGHSARLLEGAGEAQGLRSKKYNNASMPFMQRIDEYGIALHGGVNPGFPASQGCVRMPMKFAEKLFGLTKIGTEVIIEG